MLRGIVYKGMVKLDFENTEDMKVRYSVGKVSNDEANFINEEEELNRIKTIGKVNYILEMIRESEAKLKEEQSKDIINLQSLIYLKESKKTSLRLLTLLNGSIV